MNPRFAKKRRPSHAENVPLRKPLTFHAMMQLVRQGHPEAVAELVKRFEPKIHQAIRRPLSYFSLGREFDPHDISQVVLAKFFLQNLASRCELNESEQLVRLLVRMAKNKIRDELRKRRAQRRKRPLDGVENEGVLHALPSGESTPSTIVAGRELMREIHQRLSEDERNLAHQRCLGLDWLAIAIHDGRSAEALRKKLARAFERVKRELEL
jgi:DNA-directed RNA polymerase specialized sigma24 family protein